MTPEPGRAEVEAAKICVAKRKLFIKRGTVLGPH